jgi:CRP/FNR family cyclic AMP-dependent transcriptional regulator
MFDRQDGKLSEQFLARLSARGQPRTFERGETVFEEGEISDTLYVLVAGELKVFTRGDKGRELVYSVLGPGELFGELILDGGPRFASLRAVRDSNCIVVHAGEFREIMAEEPEFAAELVLRLIARMRQVTTQLHHLATRDVYARVAALLNELAVEEGGVHVIDGALTQQEIADRIGATREMVSRAFRTLARDGYIVRDGQRRMVLAKELPEQW